MPAPRPARRRAWRRRWLGPRRQPRLRVRRSFGRWSSARVTARRSVSGDISRQGRRTPTPAQSTRAAFSPMSPLCGMTSTGTPLDRDRASGSEAAEADDERACAASSARRRASRRAGHATGCRRGARKRAAVGRRRSRAARPDEGLQGLPGSTAGSDHARWRARPAPAALPPGGARAPGPAAPTEAARRGGPTLATREGIRAVGGSRPGRAQC